MKCFIKCCCLFLCLLIGLSVFAGCTKSKSFKSDYPIDDFFDLLGKEYNYTLTYKETNNGKTDVYKAEFTKNKIKFEENDDDPYFVEFKGEKAYVYRRGYSTWIKEEDDEGYFESYFAEFKNELKKQLTSGMNSSVFKYDEKEKCYKSTQKGDNTIIQFKGTSVYMKTSKKDYWSTTEMEFIFEKIGGTKIKLPKAKKVD